MKDTEEDIPVGSIAGERVPEHHAHAPRASFFGLFASEGAEDATAQEPSSLQLVSGGENGFAVSVVTAYGLAGGPVVALEIVG